MSQDGKTAAAMPPVGVRSRTRTQELVTAALLASLLAATSWLSAQIPAGPVPLTPQIIFVVLSALLLAPKWAAASLATYVVLGAAGLPVFSGGKGGFAVLTGPTGGYLFGFVAAAGLAALVRIVLAKRLPRIAADASAAVVAVVVAYAVGATQLALVLGMSPQAAFVAGVAPFVVFDAVKAALAIGIAQAIRRARG